ncbi:pectate lyase [Micromonospora citrea]|uniref:pectate lyase n=1 Tax=Micromonospora citrea TaxID=47855 RepID=UPI003C4C74E8
MRVTRKARRTALLATVGLVATTAAVAVGMSTSAFAGTLLSDTFEDGDHDGWSKSGGDWSVVSDGSKALRQADHGSELARLFAGDKDWADYRVQARVKPTSLGASGAVGIAARASSATKMYRLVLTGAGRAELQAVNGSQVTVLGAAPAAATTGGWRTLAIEVDGGTVSGYVDGARIGSGSGKLPGTGRAGLLTTRAAGTFDDVLVATPGSGTPTGAPPATTAAPTSAAPTSKPPATTAAPTSAAPTSKPPASSSPPAATATPVAAWPTPSGSQKVDATIAVPANGLDGGMKRYFGIGSGGQSESQDPMFKLAAGATLRNVVIGAPAGDGVHCEGRCTLINVWWEDVGEDAATFRGGGPFLVDGGGARSGADKVFQHNGSGTVTIRNFRIESSGKLYRACGNCSDSFERHVVLDNIVATSTKILAGINTNFGDTATLTRITILDDAKRSTRPCVKFKGVKKGSEPTEIGSGPDGVNCLYQESDITYR